MSLFNAFANLGRQYNKTLTNKPMWTVRLLNNGNIYPFNNFEDAYGFARLWNGEKLCLQYKP